MFAANAVIGLFGEGSKSSEVGREYRDCREEWRARCDCHRADEPHGQSAVAVCTIRLAKIMHRQGRAGW